MSKLKLLVIGHGRHGKDTVCEMLRDEYDYNFISSSQFCADHFIYNDLKDKYGYTTAEECYADRHNRRAEWYDMISDYNFEDPGLLGSEIFKQYDIYCGLRNIREWRKMKADNTYDFCIWVDRSAHLPPEDASSMSLTKDCADYVLDNNSSIDELHIKLKQLIDGIKP
jgi:hypothetical protein